MPKSSNRKNDTRRANRDRKQRIEELRKQQRASERRKNFLFAGSAIAVALILILAAVIPAWLHDRAQKRKSKVGYTASATSAEKAASCTGVHNDPISPPGTHVPNKTIDYSKGKYGDTADDTPPIPPSGGAHNPVTLGDKERFYDVGEKPRPERAVHNLEHGYIVVWYDASLPADQVTKLKALATTQSLNQLLVVGWWQGGDLPADKHVVLTSWGRTERCASVSDEVITNFYNDHVNKLAPEAGSGAAGGDTYPADTVMTTPTQSATASPSASTSTKKSGKK